MPTQKYKQQTQQVRVITNESGYANGMFYTDVPLSEGYAKVLLNLDIDSATGKLTPRKGLQSEGVVPQYTTDGVYINFNKRYMIVDSKVTYGRIATRPGPMCTVVHRNTKDDYIMLTSEPKYDAKDKADTLNLLSNIDTFPSRPVYPSTVLTSYGVHGKTTLHQDYFTKPIGTFAFGDSYYTFIETYTSSEQGTTPIKAYLCYTKFHQFIQSDEKVINDNGIVSLCAIEPVQNNPTQAASWGYNMLLENPYEFVCESTTANLVSITGILPYDTTGNPVLTPRKNQEVVLKGYYRAPAKYVSNTTTDVITERYYDTKKVDSLTELVGKPDVDLSSYNFGEWCLYSGDATNTSGYYMIMPADSFTTKRLALWASDYKPDATVKLSVLPTETEESWIRVRWQMKTGTSATWTDISNTQLKLTNYNSAHGSLTPFMVKTNIPDTAVFVRLTISDPADTVNGEEYIMSTNTIGITAVDEALPSTLNLYPEKYELHTCKGLIEWEQRLVLWGVKDAYNMLFVSDVNNPGYFPFPNNVDIFPDPIVSVHAYGDELLVVTTTSLYRLTWNTDGTGWMHNLIQKNLHITDEDVPFSTVIKNMFFFKSNNYYYMLVPKASSSGVKGDTTIAPISKPIENLLDNFHEIVYNLIKDMVDTPDLNDFTDYLVNYYTYVDNTKVVVNYVYDLAYNPEGADSVTDSKYLYVQLLYDTDARVWTMRAFENAHMLHVSHNDTLQQSHFIDITPVKDSVILPKLGIQYYTLQDVQDKTVQYVQDGSPVYSTRLIKNYQYTDTGNREINTELKKRFREFQFKIKNTSLTNLRLYNGFYIDGSPRQELQDYVPRVVLDNALGENIIIVDRYMDAGELQPTTLARTSTSYPCWTLNQSAFPGRTLWKVRVPITGKGYSPRAVLISKNEAQFELLGHSWVYRTMNAR